MKILPTLTAIGLLAISGSAMAWWVPFDDNHDRYNSNWNNSNWDNNNWNNSNWNNNNNLNNRWDNNAFGDFMNDMMGGMSGDMEVEIRFKVRGRGRADGRGYGFNDNHWNNSYRSYNSNRFGSYYAPYGYQPHHRQSPEQRFPTHSQTPALRLHQ